MPQILATGKNAESYTITCSNCFKWNCIFLRQKSYHPVSLYNRCISSTKRHHKTNKKTPTDILLTLKLGNQDKADNIKFINRYRAEYSDYSRLYTGEFMEAHLGDWKSLKEELSVPVWKETAGDSQTQKTQTTPLNRKSTKNRKVPKQLSGEQLRHTPLNTLN